MSNLTNLTNITIPPEVAIAVGSVLTGIGIFVVSIVIWFLLMDTIFRDVNQKRTAVDIQIYNQFLTFAILFFTVLYSIVNFFVTLAISALYFVNNNAYTVGGLLILSCGATIFLKYHNTAVSAWLVWRQCFTRVLFDTIIFPILNGIRMIWNLLIGFWDAICILIFKL